MFYTYILKSKLTGSYYIGQTNDIVKRLHLHNSGYNKSTKNGLPWELVYSEKYNTRSEAVRRENYIKGKKSKAYIENLINS